MAGRDALSHALDAAAFESEAGSAAGAPSEGSAAPAAGAPGAGPAAASGGKPPVRRIRGLAACCEPPVPVTLPDSTLPPCPGSACAQHHLYQGCCGSGASLGPPSGEDWTLHPAPCSEGVYSARVDTLQDVLHQRLCLGTAMPDRGRGGALKAYTLTLNPAGCPATRAGVAERHRGAGRAGGLRQRAHRRRLVAA